MDTLGPGNGREKIAQGITFFGMISAILAKNFKNVISN